MSVAEAVDSTAAAWRQGLPSDCMAMVVPPRRFAAHVDEEACARKLNGFDDAGRRCYVQHDHTAFVEAFDVDEFPLEVAVHHERRTAWRLWSGEWLMSVDRIERLDSCKPRVVNQTFVAAEAQLGL
ncbi:MAG: hypothetical protein QM722_19025 [Piscinibacter sp.]